MFNCRYADFHLIIFFILKVKERLTAGGIPTPARITEGLKELIKGKTQMVRKIFEFSFLLRCWVVIESNVFYPPVSLEKSVVHTLT